MAGTHTHTEVTDLLTCGQVMACAPDLTAFVVHHAADIYSAENAPAQERW